MPRKKTKTPSVYEGRWTPLFEDVPTGMSIYDIAVYGFIVRMEHMDSKKSTASAATIGSIIHASEKTVDRALTQLEQWKIIRCVYRGKSLKEPSHFVSRPRKEWDEDTINAAAQNITDKRRIAGKKAKLTRDSLSSTRDSLSSDKGLPVQDKGLRVPQRDIKRVYIRNPKRLPPGKLTKENKEKASISPSQLTAPQSNFADANPTPIARPPSPFFLDDRTINSAALRAAFDATGLPDKEYGAWSQLQLEKWDAA